MPTRAQIEETLRTHFEAWNAGDRERWIGNWHPDVVMVGEIRDGETAEIAIQASSSAVGKTPLGAMLRSRLPARCQMWPLRP